jgi:hypothetical protein
MLLACAEMTHHHRGVNGPSGAVVAKGGQVGGLSSQLASRGAQAGFIAGCLPPAGCGRNEVAPSLSKWDATAGNSEYSRFLGPQPTIEQLERVTEGVTRLRDPSRNRSVGRWGLGQSGRVGSAGRVGLVRSAIEETDLCASRGIYFGESWAANAAALSALVLANTRFCLRIASSA